MKMVRPIVAAAAFAALATVSIRAHAQAPLPPPPPQPATELVGVWSLNRDLSDTDAAMAPRGDMRGGGGGYGRGGGRGGRGGGGFGGGFPGGGGGGGYGGRGANDPDAARRMNAMRDILEAPERLTITSTESMVIVTTGDGRTTRYSLDNKKIKDESTNMDRKSKWDAGKLTSEVTGSGPKITEVYSFDPAHHELLVTVKVEGEGRSEVGRLVHRLYEAQGR